MPNSVRQVTGLLVQCGGCQAKVFNETGAVVDLARFGWHYNVDELTWYCATCTFDARRKEVRDGPDR